MSDSATATTVNEAQEKKSSIWGAPFSGGSSPFNISSGKLMMWIFLLSDVFIFGALLFAYGSVRFSLPYWPDPNEVFSSFFGIPNMPMASVSLMTFILIMSSVTMVLAVQAGHNRNQKQVTKWMIVTIIGGLIFLGCQAFEWTDLILDGVVPSHNMLGPIVNGQATAGPPAFGGFFFLITGFHGFHVTIGLTVNIIVLINVIKGTYAKRGHYEMVEKAGLYWHFVDLVWVYVFTCYYLL